MTSLTSYIPHFTISRFVQVTPNKFFYSVGSTFAAAALGAGYALVGRIAYPKAGMIPHHYAIWFAVAFQIAQGIISLEKRFHQFIAIGSSDDLSEMIDNSFQPNHEIRKCILKIFRVKDSVLNGVDLVFSKVLGIRSHSQVTQQNVEDSSFAEMCRYRLWTIFKSTVLELVSFELGYLITQGIGFSLPSRTSLSLLLVIHSVVQGIIIIPALHVYARVCADIAMHVADPANKSLIDGRVKWVRSWLPSL